MGDLGAQMIISENHLRIHNDSKNSCFLKVYYKIQNWRIQFRLMESGEICKVHNPELIDAGEWCFGHRNQI